MFVRSAMNYDVRKASDAVGMVIDPAEDRTQQHFKEECDINVLVRRFGVTGQMHAVPKVPLEGDFSDVVDFQTAMNVVRQSEEAFMQLPAALRKRFGHDPQAMLEFLGDDKNRDEAVKLGLVAKPVEKSRDAVVAIDELAAKIVPRETK